MTTSPIQVSGLNGQSRNRVRAVKTIRTHPSTLIEPEPRIIEVAVAITGAEISKSIANFTRRERRFPQSLFSVNLRSREAAISRLIVARSFERRTSSRRLDGYQPCGFTGVGHRLHIAEAAAKICTALNVDATQKRSEGGDASSAPIATPAAARVTAAAKMPLARPSAAVRSATCASTRLSLSCRMKSRVAESAPLKSSPVSFWITEHASRGRAFRDESDSR